MHSDEREAEEAIRRSLRFLDYRPRSREETRRHLHGLGYSQSVIMTAIERLESCGYINDHEFARLYFDELYEKGFGYHRIKDRLFAKGIDRMIIEETLANLRREQELERACRLGEKYLRRLSGDGSQQARKLRDHLVRRGFGSEIAEEASMFLVRADVDSDNRRE